MFRRHSAPDSGPAPDGEPTGISPNGDGLQASRAHTAAKGRPTPKRSQAAPRRQPMAAPGSRKQAYKQTRERQRAERTRRLDGMRRGDPKYLPVKDQGPVRALARDYVDSRRLIGEYYLYMVGFCMILLVLGFITAKSAPTVASDADSIGFTLFLVTFLAVLVESAITTRRVRALAAKRFPGESTRGLGFYTFVRSAQVRKARLPKPRVERGAQI